MSDFKPVPVGPVHVVDTSASGDLTVSDLSLMAKWRVFAEEDADVKPGTSRRDDDQMIWSVSPGEWTILGLKPFEIDSVDLTHVRAMFRLTGGDAPRLLAKLCALDFDDRIFPDRAAARSLFAGVATELIRDDQAGVPSYLIVPSRSFGRFVYKAISDAGEEFGLVEGHPANPNG